MPDEDLSTAPISPLTVACAVGLLVGALALVFHLAAGALVCDSRTSENLSVYFPSHQRGEAVGGFTTGVRGRYCIVWAEERGHPTAEYGTSHVDISAPWRPFAAQSPRRDARPEQGHPVGSSR